MTRRPAARPAAAAVLALAVALTAGACAPADGATPEPTDSAASDGASGAAHPPGTAVLAFAGDVHFEGASAGTTDLGSAFDVLADADLAVVNLETAVTTGGSKVDKQYAFRAPPAAVRALADAGVDAVSLANNHGMDYGAAGLQDTLAAGRAAHLPVLGAGDDVDAAFAPLRTTAAGVEVSVIAATDVIDSSVETAWTATAAQPGLASAKDEARLLADVRTEARAGRVVVVFLHWGQERVQCATARQTSLADDLAAAGADVVVGSHAHVLEPTAQVGSGSSSALVAYGLGNFHFYADDSKALATQTGVLTVDVDAGGVVGSAWHPARIRSGKPELLSAAAMQGTSRSADELAELGQRCAAGEVPAAEQPQRSAGPGAPAAGAGDGSGDGGPGDDGPGDDGPGDDGPGRESPAGPSLEPAPSAAPSTTSSPSASSPPAASPTASAAPTR